MQDALAGFRGGYILRIVSLTACEVMFGIRGLSVAWLTDCGVLHPNRDVTAKWKGKGKASAEVIYNHPKGITVALAVMDADSYYNACANFCLYDSKAYNAPLQDAEKCFSNEYALAII